MGEQPGLRFQRDIVNGHCEAFFRENSAFGVYELFIRKAVSSWLTLGVQARRQEL